MSLLALYLLPVAVIFFFVLIGASVKILREYERAVVFTLGRFQKVKGPGLVLLIPLIQQMVRVDLRIQLISVIFYLINMNVVTLLWTSDTAMSKLDGYLSRPKRLALSFLMTNVAGWVYCLPLLGLDFTGSQSRPVCI